MALITPGFLPVPAVKGGGGEMLITKLIEQNEVEKKFDIDLYTIEDKQIKKKKYKQTNIIFIKTSYLNNLFARIVNKIANILNKKIHINPYGNKVSILLKEKKYDYLLIENNMYIFKKINESYPYKCKKIFHLHNDIGGIQKKNIVLLVVRPLRCKNDDICHEQKVRLKGSTKYEIHYVREKTYNINEDYYIGFRAKYIVNKLRVCLDYPDDIDAIFTCRGTQLDFEDVKNSKRRIEKKYKSIILPRQGYIFALRKIK